MPAQKEKCFPPTKASRGLMIFAVLLGLVAAVHAQWTPMNPVTGVQQQADGVVFTLKTGTLKVLVCSDSIAHVLYSPTAAFPCA